MIEIIHFIQMADNQTIRNLNSILIITLLIMAGCSDKDNQAQPVISGILTDYSDCKNEKSESFSIDWDTNYCILYSYEIDSMTLYMKHLNAIFNCCNFGLSAAIEEVNDTIIIREHENDNLCSCVCEFDLNFEITGVQQRFYWIKLVVPKDYYIVGENPMIFSIDLSINDEGEYCW
jgi:hypothetical protein